MPAQKLQTLRDTKKLATSLARSLHGGDVVALTGALGAGKTTFTQFLAAALGVKRDVKSPSFNILHLHTIPPRKGGSATTFCHIDCYRISADDELDAIGIGDYLGQPDVITVVEWAEKIPAVLPERTRWLHFDVTGGKRRVTMSTLMSHGTLRLQR